MITIRKLLVRQDGSALVTAMLVMALCLIIGLSVMATVDRLTDWSWPFPGDARFAGGTRFASFGYHGNAAAFLDERPDPLARSCPEACAGIASSSLARLRERSTISCGITLRDSIQPSMLSVSRVRTTGRSTRR